MLMDLLVTRRITPCVLVLLLVMLSLAITLMDLLLTRSITARVLVLLLVILSLALRCFTLILAIQVMTLWGFRVLPVSLYFRARSLPFNIWRASSLIQVVFLDVWCMRITHVLMTESDLL